MYEDLDQISLYDPPADPPAPVVQDAPEPMPAEATPTVSVNYYEIDETAAKRAKDMNSFYDYRQGSTTAEYRSSVDEVAEIARRQKERVHPMYHDKIDHYLEKYARKLAENMNERNHIDARVPSVLIAGPANFPVRAKEKQNAARDRNMGDYRYIRGLVSKIKSIGTGGISADRPDALEALEAKLVDCIESQEEMKEVNAYYRKHKTLDDCPCLTEHQIQRLKADMARDWHTSPQPFPSFHLQNNNAEIHRIERRIKELTFIKEAEFKGWEFDGGTVQADKEANRLQIFFDGKPDEAQRKELKGNGFRWAPSIGAWQRQLNQNAFRAADRIPFIHPVSGEKPLQLQPKTVQQKPEPERGR